MKRKGKGLAVQPCYLRVYTDMLKETESEGNKGETNWNTMEEEKCWP